MCQNKNLYILSSKSCDPTFSNKARHRHYCDSAWVETLLVSKWPTSVGVGPLGRHDRALAVVPHPLRASLQLLQPNPQLSLLPAQTALQLLCELILLLQLLKGERLNLRHGQALSANTRHHRRWWGFSDTGEKNNNTRVCPTLAPGCCVYLYVKLGSSQQVEGGVPHGVRWQGDLLLELLQAVP